MKKFLLAAILLQLGLFDVDAQTLKNIHRKNLPTLHIPTHLIDKVETVLDGNVRKLKITQTDGFVSLIPTADIDSITHSEGQAINPAQLGDLITANIVGRVRNELGHPISNAIVKSDFSPQETKTDGNGVFFLNDFVVYEKLGFITIEKPGYFKGSRSFLPLENGANRVEIQLLPKTISGTFNSSSGGQVTAGILQITFPINAIVQANGQPYAGTVNVFARALDLSSQEMFDQMPGDLLGGLNDSLRLLRSFGMAAVELFDSNNEPLQLASGQNATMRFTIPTSMLNEAPETIAWWSFDEEAGYWKHEGTAQKNGNEYLGQASHFSWWNVDVPSNFVDFNGVVNNIEGNPISGALIEVITPNLGIGIRYTNSEGFFTGRVPKNQNLVVNIKLTCNSTNDWALAHSENIQTEELSIDIQFTANFNGLYPITGTILNCQSQAAPLSYIKMGSNIFFAANGQFTIQACATGPYSLRGFLNSDPVNFSASSLISVQVTTDGADVGNINACDESFGFILDIDGNVYLTHLIAGRLWMVENLKTSRFSDGSLIANVTDASWTQLNTPAWCAYNNNIMYENIFGKLYNWFSVTDPSSLCPQGWHVPSDLEWITNEVFLGMDANEIYLTGERGVSANVGGKLKTREFWLFDDLQSTNSSKFSGLPGGWRDIFLNQSYNATIEGRFWSSTIAPSDFAWARLLNINSIASRREPLNKRYGISVRCIKD